MKAIMHFEGVLHTQNWNFFNNVINIKRNSHLKTVSSIMELEKQVFWCVQKSSDD